jgi:acyl carrier protein
MAQPTETQPTAKIIETFIRERFLYDRPDAQLTPDLPLIEQRLIDSLQLMQLVQFLQERFGIWIDVTDLMVENFATIDTMAAFVERLKR